ncbi:MAG: glycosyltransferase [Ignavibacteriae bacterium]|nr:glycosyltransferase [Ignavibacteriota bacterium]
MRISYAITLCNEFVEIQRLVSFLLENKRSEDEIVVLYDSKNGNPKVEQFLRAKSINGEFAWIPGEFDGHFADWKNKLTSMCSGDWIFQIDADEIPHLNLIQYLPEVLESNPEVDMLRVPRVNTVEGLTEEHIKKWGWNVNEKGWVNWADWQMRIYRRHPDIKWVNNVHEVIKGYKVHGMLPTEEEWALYHPKDIERQIKQNNYYNTL